MMIHYQDKKLKIRLHVLEVDMINLKKQQKKNIDSKNASFTGHVPNDRHCTCFSNK